MKSLNSFENGFSEKLRCDRDHLCGADGKKIFICHSSDDKLYADLIEKFLEKIGFKNIFYSSSSNSRGIFPSEDIYERLINELNYGKLHTIFLLSNSFYNSPTSIAEIGAVWIKSK